MKVSELRAMLALADNEAEITVLNTWDGEFYPVEDISAGRQLMLEVTIHLTR